MQRSKYASLGIMDFIERKFFGGIPRFKRDSMFRSFCECNPISRSDFSKRIYSAKRHGFVKYFAGNEGLILTKKGRDRLNTIRFNKITLVNKTKDGYWHMIIFDIPEKKNWARKLFRDKLLGFDCFQLQKSVYVTPYICEKEIKEVVKLLDIEKSVNVILIQSLGDAGDKVRSHFK